MTKMMLKRLGVLAIWLCLNVTIVCGAEMKVPVIFSGGHETDRQDGGRPVVLIAAGLGVKTEIFREAFRGVTPARDGKPSPEQARRNKEALLKVLKPHGITNEQLDKVSDYYRYRPDKREMWPVTPAKAHAVVEDGQIKQIVVTEPGSGYSSAPVAKVEGFETTKLKVTLQFGKDLKANGSIRSIEVDSPAAKARDKR